MISVRISLSSRLATWIRPGWRCERPRHRASYPAVPVLGGRPPCVRGPERWPERHRRPHPHGGDLRRQTPAPSARAVAPVVRTRPRPARPRTVGATARREARGIPHRRTGGVRQVDKSVLRVGLRSIRSRERQVHRDTARISTANAEMPRKNPDGPLPARFLGTATAIAK